MGGFCHRSPLSPQPKEDFKRLGQLVGMLGILCQDPDQATQHSSLEGLGHLHQLLVHQRGELPPASTASHLTTGPTATSPRLC